MTKIGPRICLKFPYVQIWQKRPKGSVLNGQSEFVNDKALKNWFRSLILESLSNILGGNFTMENRVQKVYKHLGWLMSLKVRVMNVWVNVFVEWNRRVEPEGPNELEKAMSVPKETKIAELLKKLDSRRELELPAIEEEQEEDVDADTESAVDEATPAAITETNDDNQVVAERQLVAAVNTGSERSVVATVATSSESTQTDTARKLSRSTQTAKPKNREDSAKVMACLMLSTVNDIMAAVMKAFHHTTYVSSHTNYIYFL